MSKKNKNRNKQQQPISSVPSATPQPVQPTPVAPAAPVVSAAPSPAPPQNHPCPAIAPQPQPPKPEADWHKHIATIGVITAFILNLIALFLATKQNNKNFLGLQEQIRLQHEINDQSRPIDFDAVSEALPTGDLHVGIRNRGEAEIIRVKGQFKYYFVFSDGQVRSRIAVQDLLRSDTNLLSTCRAAGLLVNPEDIQRLLGTAREFAVARLQPTEKDSFEPEFSQASILNATRLAQCLKAKALMRWRFEYQHRVSRQRFTTTLYLLVEPEPSSQPLQVRARAVLDLNKTLGGKTVIDAIDRIE